MLSQEQMVALPEHGLLLCRADPAAEYSRKLEYLKREEELIKEEELEAEALLQPSGQTLQVVLTNYSCWYPAQHTNKHTDGTIHPEALCAALFPP